MSVSIEVLLELNQAEQAANDWQNQFVREAKEATGKSEEEVKKYAQKVKAHMDKSAADMGRSYEKFANEARGFVGDVGDAVGALGKGLLGLSESQQVVADKTIYMTEKGAALGGSLGSLLGPLGMLAGSGIGAGVGGLLGWFAGNSEAAAIETEKLNKAVVDQVKIAKDLMAVWARADSLKAGVGNITEGYNALTDAIDKTLNKQDLSKVKSKDITERLIDDEKKLGDAKEAASKKRSEIDTIETEINRIKLKQTDDVREKTLLLNEQETALSKAKEEFNAISKQANTYIQDYNEYTAEAERRTSALTKGKKEASKDLKQEILDLLAAKKAREEMGLIDREGMRDPRDEAAELKEALALLQEEMEPQDSILDTEGLYEARDVVVEMAEATKNLHKEFGIMGASMKATMGGIADIAKNAIAGVATQAFDNWLETIATGAKDADKSFKKIAAAMIRSIGQQLVADGIKNILMGGAELIATAGVKGGALVAAGGAEIAAGVGMGAGSAKAQRRQGYGDDRASGGSSQGNLGRGASQNTGTITQAPSIIQIHSLLPNDQRSWERLAQTVNHAQSYQRRP